MQSDGCIWLQYSINPTKKDVVLPVKFIFIFTLLIGFIIADEPSVFEMQSSVTKKEFEELKEINNQQSDRIFTLENKINQLETSLEGLKSIYEGYSVNIKGMNDKINSISNQIPQESQAKEEDLNALKGEVANNKKNIQTLKDSIDTHLKQIQELVTNEINQKNEQAQRGDSKKGDSQTNDSNTIKEILDNNSTITSKDSKDITDNKEEKSFNKDSTRRSEIFTEARSLTYSKKFDEAIARYKWLIEIDYKSAESNYMLGNIAYEQNRYKDAVYYYKESATIDDKATYMPRLLLNSANSFRVLNDKDSANKFYNAVIKLFPDSVEAEESKKYMAN